MIQLYYYPNNASLAPHFVLEEMGVDFELVLVDRKSDAQKSAQYLALNPAGRIPTLVDNGTAIFETAAICLHLCDRFPEANLIPPAADINRAKCYQWLMYLTNTVQAELMVYFYPQKHTSVSEAVEDLVSTHEKRVTEMFALLDNALQDKDFLVGDSITICDHYLLMLAIWADEFAKPPLSFNNLNRYLRNLAKRAAIRAVCDKENISLADYQ
jgi:glutathione S-transferase